MAEHELTIDRRCRRGRRSRRGAAASRAPSTCGSGRRARGRRRCARTPCGRRLAFWPTCIAIRAYSASRSASSASIASATATARSARSTLTACSRLRAQALDERVRRPARWPTATARGRCPGPGTGARCSATRRLQVALDHRSGGSMSVSPVSASVTLADELLADLVELAAADAARGSTSRHSSTVSNSPRFSATHSSVSSGSDELLHALDRDGEVGRLLGALRRRGERQLVAGRGADRAASSKSSATQPWPISYDQSSVLRPATSSPSRVADEVERDEVAASRPGGRRRRARRARRSSASIGLVDLLVGGVGRRQLDAQAAVAGHGDLGTDLASWRRTRPGRPPGRR